MFATPDSKTTLVNVGQISIQRRRHISLMYSATWQYSSAKSTTEIVGPISSRHLSGGVSILNSQDFSGRFLNSQGKILHFLNLRDLIKSNYFSIINKILPDFTILRKILHYFSILKV